jgi:hypothetical protein
MGGEDFDREFGSDIRKHGFELELKASGGDLCATIYGLDGSGRKILFYAYPDQKTAVFAFAHHQAEDPAISELRERLEKGGYSVWGGKGIIYGVR